MANYKLNEEAEEDIGQLYRYGILNFGLKEADRYYDGLFEHFDKLAENPRLFWVVDHIRPGYRRHPIYCRLDDETVQIMRIFRSTGPPPKDSLPRTNYLQYILLSLPLYTSKRHLPVYINDKKTRSIFMNPLSIWLIFGITAANGEKIMQSVYS